MKPKYGYMGKMLFVNLTSGRIHEEELSDDVARLFLGSVGVGGKVVYEHLKPQSDPLSPDNILGFGTGPLTLSSAYCACRFLVMGKSPLTGYWGTASGGGTFANALKASGYDLLFITGKAERPVYLSVQNEKPELKNAHHIWGKDTVETEQIIREDEGNEKIRVACIGPAGERLARIAAVINDGGRAAGRSGFGAVMGSKNLKAVACYGEKKPEVCDEAKVEDLMKAMYERVKANPNPMFKDLTEAGTCCAVVQHLATHDTPIKNWSGDNVKDFPEGKWEKVGLLALKKHIIGKYFCPGCPIGCGGWVTVETGRFAVKKAHKPEYESIAAFGPLCLNDNIESIIYASDLCNRYGLDTISTGATIAFAMECFENGMLTEQETHGLKLNWGDSEAMIALLQKICMREGIGDVLADGARWAARRIGKGAERFSMDVCGEMVPMHDPRYAVGWGLGYIVEPEAAKHTRGHFIEFLGAMRPVIAENLGLPPKVDRYDISEERVKHQTAASAWFKCVTAAGACLFGHDSMDYPLLEALKAVTGWDLSYKELMEIGLRINTLLHVFNLSEGWRPDDYKLPPRVCGYPPLSEGLLKGVSIDYERLKRLYYKSMGWDVETGEVPQRIIEQLKLQHTVKRM